MPPLAKRIVLLASLFSLVIGLFLLGNNLGLISQEAKTTALNLWPVLLVIAGFMLLADSTRKRSYVRAARMQMLQFPISLAPTSTELSCRVQFSYGRLEVRKALAGPRLLTEQVGPSAEPVISEEVIGARSELAITISQPLFPSHFQLSNTWHLELPSAMPLRLSLQVHEAALSLDLRDLDVESLELRMNAGFQRIQLGRPAKKLTGQIYASGSDLSLILPTRVFAWVRLLNPFCRVDYPQGDFVKREDGSLITPASAEAKGSVEIDIDGPIRALVLDIEDSPET
jgi:hypothetical protein